MRERSEMALKIVCGVLAALLLFQIGRMLFRASPLRGVRVPDLPALSVGSNQPPAKATNAIAGSVAVTNATNTVANAKPGKVAANTNAVQAATRPETNAVAKSAEARTTNPTPTLVLTNSGTNVASSWKPGMPVPSRPSASKPPSSRTTTASPDGMCCGGCTTSCGSPRESSSGWSPGRCSTWWWTSAGTRRPGASGRGRRSR